MEASVAPPQAEAEPKTKEKTNYTVLEKVTVTGDPPGGSTYQFVKTVSAVSASAAVKSLGKEGTYVAVPTRSFNPVTVKAETQTVLKLS